MHKNLATGGEIMKKRIISLLMALLMLTSLLPTAVWAEGDAPEQTAAAAMDGGAAEQEPAATPETPETPEAPEAPVEPEQPAAPEIPETPETPAIPEEPEVPTVPQTPADETQGEDEGIRVEDDGDWLDGGMCGAKVEWMVSTDYRLFIWGSGEMDDFTYDDNGNNTRPWEQYRERIWYFAVQDNVTHIGAYAFAEMHLSSFNLTNAIVSIGEGAFENTSYERITFSGKLTTIGEDAFRQSWNLTTITLPGTLKSISDCFWQCYSLQTIKFGGTSAQWEAAGGDNIYLPLGTTVQCTDRNLTRSYSGQSEDGLNWKLTHDGTLTISGSGPMTDYELYPDSPFSNAPWGEHYWRIKKIVISEGVTHVGDVAFCHGQSVASVSLPSTLISIGWSSFFSCQSLSDITIPASVTKIGPEAFFQYSDNGAFHTDIHYKGTAQQWYQAGGNSAYNPQFTTVYCQGKALSITSGQCGDNATWYFADGTLTIKGSGAIYDYEYIQEDFRAYSTAPWWAWDEVKHVVVEEGITHIGAYAFSILVGAESVSLPNSLKSIGDDAFFGIGVSSLVIPDNVTEIGYYAFNACNNLETITLPAGLREIGPCFIESPNLQTITFKGTMDQWIACGGGASTFPATAKVICAQNDTLNGSGTCDDGLTWTLDNNGKLTISGSGEMADYYYDDNDIPTAPWAKYRSMIRSIEIRSGVTYIGAWAFEDTNITSLTIPGSVKTIGRGSFSNNRYLANLTLNSGLEIIGVYAFGDCRIGSVVIPDGVTLIGDRAFAYCVRDDYVNGKWVDVGLTSITIPASVTHIWEKAFVDCDLLETVNFEGSEAQWKAIGGEDAGVPDTATITFNNNNFVSGGSCGTGLTWTLNRSGVLIITGSGAIPNYIYAETPWWDLHISQVVVCQGVSSIGKMAFAYMKDITSVTIADSVTSISQEAFRECTSLTSITLPASVTSIVANAFYGCDELEYIYYGGTVAQWKDTVGTIVALPLHTEVVCSDDYILQPLEGSCGQGVSYRISEDGTLTISGKGKMADYSYNNNDSSDCPWQPVRYAIRKVVIENGVTHIGSDAFAYNINVTSIAIPGSVTSIGAGAFNGCEGLESAFIPGTVKEIGKGAFYCHENASLKTIYFSGTESQWNTLSQNIGLPDGVNIEYVKLGIITSGGAEPNVGDMQALYESLTGQKDLIYKQQMAADVNQDGEIDVYDLQRLYEAVNRINPL